MAGKKEKPLSAMLTIAVGLGPSAEIRKYHILHLHIYILCCLLGYIYISTSIVAYQATFTYLHILLNTGLHLHIYILCCIHLHIYNFCCIPATFTYLQLLLHTSYIYICTTSAAYWLHLHIYNFCCILDYIFSLATAACHTFGLDIYFQVFH